MNGKYNPLIFIAGIHGVGKTTLCLSLANTIGVECLDASKLIADQKKLLCMCEIDSGKDANDMHSNQHLLIEAITQRQKEKKWYLLTGHFSLINSSNTIQALPIYVFEAIRPAQVILLVDTVEDISRRIFTRDNVQYDTALLAEMQEIERRQARIVADKLGISVCEAKPDEITKLVAVVKRTISEYGEISS